ncbi:MAG: hypothetical protein O7G85_00415, partial [Planctomycetota bacterium]|nr:hypothetical protein [Planctomycetota bacterium]
MKKLHANIGTLVLLCSPSIAQGQDALEVTRAYREANGARILEDFKTLLAIPNDSHDVGSLWRNVMHLAMDFELLDVDMDIKTIPRKDNVPPLLYGKIDVPGATRTIGIYVHYDGQPADPEQWTNPPYEPTLYSRAMEDGGELIEFPDPEGNAPIDPEWR